MTTRDTTPQHPELIARALLIEDGSVLLCKNLEKGYYYLPGGHIEAGETASAALRRELQEEARLDIRVGSCALINEMLADGLHEVNIVFHVERPGDEQITSAEAHIGFEWLDLAAVTDADIRPTSIRAWIASGGETEGDRPGFLSTRA